MSAKSSISDFISKIRGAFREALTAEPVDLPTQAEQPSPPEQSGEASREEPITQNEISDTSSSADDSTQNLNPAETSSVEQNALQDFAKIREIDIEDLSAFNYENNPLAFSHKEFGEETDQGALKEDNTLINPQEKITTDNIPENQEPDQNNPSVSPPQDRSFSVSFQGEGAGYQNTLGYYEVTPDGSIINVNIGFHNASARGSGGSLEIGDSFDISNIAPGNTVGFFVIANGNRKNDFDSFNQEEGHFEFRTDAGDLASIHDATPSLYYVAGDSATEIKSQYGDSGNGIFHTMASENNNFALNGDGLNHFVFTPDPENGTIRMGNEDLLRGGDKDFDDVVFDLNLGKDNFDLIFPPSDDNQGDNTFYGSTGDDILFGGDGNDTLGGVSGNDILRGGKGDDTLDGGMGSDSIFAGLGNDVAIFDINDTQINMGSGEDTVKLFGDDVDLSSFSDIVSNVEIIDLDASSKMTIDSDFLATEEAKAMDGLVISGEDGAAVVLDDSFNATDDVTIDGQSYTVYESGDFSVSIENDISVTVATESGGV